MSTPVISSLPYVLRVNKFPGANPLLTFAAARIEDSTQEIHTSTARIEVTTAPIERQLIFDSNQVAEPKHMEGRINNLNTTNLVSGVTKSTIPDAYLRYQVDELVKALAQLPIKDHTYPVKAPLGNYLQPFQSVITLSTPHADREARHRDVVKKTLEILQRLQQGSTNLPIQEGAWDMVNLAISLHQLGMLQEAASCNYWVLDCQSIPYAIPGRARYLQAISRPLPPQSRSILSRNHLREGTRSHGGIPCAEPIPAGDLQYTRDPESTWKIADYLRFNATQGEEIRTGSSNCTGSRSHLRDDSSRSVRLG